MGEQIFQSLLPSLAHFQLLGYWIAFFAALGETALAVGLLVPGSTLLLLLGALAAAGHLEVVGLYWFAVAGAILGDNLNYWLGRRYGHRWLRNGIGFLTPAHFQQAQAYFQRHGAKSVFLGRFVPSLKEVVPFMAGTTQMRRPSFYLWNVLGALGWGLQWVGGGYLFGQSLTMAKAWMSRVGLAVLALLLTWILLWLLKRVVQRRGPEVWRLLISLSRSVAQAVRGNPYVKRFGRRHPGVVRFLAARVDRSAFHGLPLTLSGLALLYLLALLGGIVEDLVTSDPIVALDQLMAQLVVHFRPPALIAPFVWLSALGVSWVVGPVLLLAIAVMGILRCTWLALPLLVSSLGAAGFTVLSKLIFQRPRPLDAVLQESAYSFPSGHATIAVACYGFLGYLLIRAASGWKTRVNLFFLTGVLILGIGLSRIGLGVHYLSDVWAGYLVGGIWLIIGISLSEWLIASGQLLWPHAVEPARRWMAVLLGLGALAWYAGFGSQWQPPRQVTPPVTAVALSEPIPGYFAAHRLAYTESLLGEPLQPLSLVFVANDAPSLIASLDAAGWHQADPTTLRNLWRLAREGMAYTSAPLAPAFWNGQVNDWAFEQPVPRGQGASIATLRVWDTPFRIHGHRLFTGVTREYTGRQRLLMPEISPDVDAMAERVVQTLRAADLLQASCRVPMVPAMTGTYMMGEPFFSRGALWIVALSDAAITADTCDQKSSQQ